MPAVMIRTMMAVVVVVVVVVVVMVVVVASLTLAESRIRNL